MSDVVFQDYTPDTPKQTPNVTFSDSADTSPQAVQNQARSRLVNLGIDPQETSARQQIAQTVAPALGLSPSFVHQNTDAIGQQLYGKTEPPATLWSRIGNSVKAASLTNQQNRLHAQVASLLTKGQPVPSELQQQIDDLEKQMPAPDAMLKGLPNGIVQMGYSFGAGIENVGEVGTMAALKALSTWNPLVTKETVDKVGSVYGNRDTSVGSKYAELSQMTDSQGRKMDPKTAADIATTAGKILDVLQLIPFGGAAGVGVEVAGKELFLGGAFNALAKSALIGGAFGFAQGVTQVTAETIAKNISNQVDGTTFTPIDAVEALKTVGIDAGIGAAGNVVLTAPGALTGVLRGLHVRPDGPLDRAMKDVTPPKPLELPPPETKVAPTATEVTSGKPLEGVAKAPESTQAPEVTPKPTEQPPRTVGELLAPEEPVGRMTPEQAKAEAATFSTPEEFHQYMETMGGAEDLGQHDPAFYRQMWEDANAKAVGPVQSDQAWLAEMQDRNRMEQFLGDLGTSIKKGDSYPPAIYANAIRVARGQGHITDQAHAIILDMMKKNPDTYRSIEFAIHGDQEGGRAYEEYRQVQVKAQQNREELMQRIAADPTMDAQQRKIAGLKDALKSAKAEAKGSNSLQVESLQEALDSARQEYRLGVQQVKDEITGAYKQKAADSRERARANKLIKELQGISTEHMPEGIKKPLEAFLSQFNLSKAGGGNLAYLESIKAAIESGVTPTIFDAHDLARVGELSKKDPRDLNIEELQAVRDIAKAYETAARNAHTILVNGQRLDADIAREQMIAEMKPLEYPKEVTDYAKENGITNQEAEERVITVKKNGKLQKIGSGIQNSARFGAVIEQSMATTVSRIGHGDDTKLFRSLVTDPSKGVSEEWRISQKMGDIIKDWSEAFKKSDPEHRTLSKYLNEQVEIPIAGMKIKIERGQRIAMAGLLQTEGGADALYNGFALSGDVMDGKIHHPDPAVVQKIVDSMDPQEKDFLENVVHRIGKEQGDMMIPVFERQYGYRPKMLDFYYPLYHILNFDENSTIGVPEEDIIAQRRNQNLVGATVDKSHLIERVGSKKPLWIRNVGNDLTDMIDFGSKFTALSEVMNTANRIVKNKNFKDAVTARYGRSTYRYMMDTLKLVSGHKDSLKEWERVVLNLRSKGINGVLGINIPVAVLNRLLVGRSLSYVPVGDWMRGQTQVMLHPKTVHEYWLSHSPLFRKVWQSGSMQEITEVLNSGKSNAITRFSMVPEKWGFGKAILGEMNSAKVQFDREAASGHLSPDIVNATNITDKELAGMSSADKEQQAIRYAESVVMSTHANPNPMYQSFLSHDGVMGTLVTTLGSERNAGLNMLIRKGLNIRSEKGGRRFATAMIYMVLIEPALVYAARYGTRIALTAAGAAIIAGLTGTQLTKKHLQAIEQQAAKSVGSMVEEEANQIAGSFYGVGGLEYGVMEMLKTKGRFAGRSSSGLMGEYMGYGMSVVQDIIKSQNAKSQKARDANYARAVVDFLSVAAPLIGGVPFIPASSIARGIINVAEGMVR